MSTDRPGGDPNAERGDQDDSIERIADPEDYAKRRRLRQLYDAREHVRDVKNRAHRLEITERSVSKQRRDRIIAEALVDYIAELRPILDRRGDDEAFLEEEVETKNGTSITLGDIRTQRGQINTDSGGRFIAYQTSMRAWDVANTYFEEIAGATFETEGLPKDTGFQSVEKEEDDDE